MTIDIEKLEELAKATDAAGKTLSQYIYARTNFYCAATPSTILSLIAKLKQAQKDAERLDYMDKFIGGFVAGGLPGEVAKFRIVGDHEWFPNIRAAIDAAMEKRISREVEASGDDYQKLRSAIDAAMQSQSPKQWEE